MSDLLLCSGSTLGAYRLVERLGRGGMGEVWLARQDANPCVPPVALKVIHSDQSTDAKVRGMFFDEVGIAKAIQHPNVVKISDCQEASGVLFAVMEYVRGASLQELLSAAEAKGQAIPLAIALRIVVEAVAGLDAAHRLCDSSGQSLAIVHRDVSPQNLLVSSAGVTRLIDFGIAKATTRLSETTKDVIKGKARYMAPEQALARDVDGRADLWAVGMILYRLLAGRFPFGEASEIQAIGWLLSDEPIPDLPTSVPTPVGTIVRWLLERNVSRRIPSALELLQRLERIGAEVPIATNADVASFVQDLCGSELDTRQLVLDSADQTLIQTMTMAEGTLPYSRPNPGGTAPRTRRWMVTTLAAICVVAGASGFALARRAPTEPTSAKPAPSQPDVAQLATNAGLPSNAPPQTVPSTLTPERLVVVPTPSRVSGPLAPLPARQVSRVPQVTAKPGSLESLTETR